RISPVSLAPSTRTTASWARSESTGTCPGWTPISPSTVFAMTMSPSPAQTSRSGETISTKSFFDTATNSSAGGWVRQSRTQNVTRVRPRRLALQLLGLLHGHLDVADIEEGLLGQVVVLTVTKSLEGGDGLLQRHEHARVAGELLGHEHVLRQEALQATGPVDDDLVLFGQLVHTEDRDLVLQVVVALQDLLDPLGHVVVLLAHVLRVEDARCGGQRVHRRVNTLLRDRPGKLGRRVQVGERGRRGGVGVVVRGDVDRLHRGDRVASRGGDSLLQLAHLVRQVGLVTHRRGHPAQQRGDFHTSLGETEDVVDEQEHVLLLDVAEVLRHRQRRQRHTQPGPRGLVHLAEDQGGVRKDTHLVHLQEEVRTLTGALTDTGEHGHTTEVAGDTGDHLLDEHRLAHTGTTEQTDLPTTHVRGEQ